MVLGFGFISLAVVGTFLYLVLNLSRGIEFTRDNLEVYSPSARQLNELNDLISETKLLVKNWVFIDKQADTPDKRKLMAIYNKEYPATKAMLNNLVVNWPVKEQAEFSHLLTLIEDTLFVEQKSIINTLNSFKAYEDPEVLFTIVPSVGDDGSVTNLTDKVINQLGAFHARIDNMAGEGNQKMLTTFISFRIFIIILGVALVLGSIFIGFLTSREIIGPITALRESLAKKSKGVFEHELVKERHDEIGDMSRALAEMTNSIQHIVTEIKNTSSQLASSSKKVNESAFRISEGANEQASSAEEVSASMEEMTSIINQNAENAGNTEKIALQVAEDVQKISEAVNNTTKAMKDINDKISIVGDIAFQTNLLALNAAVEAARAGEHGKGFAVVAAEVRKLAERSKIAADEINGVSDQGMSVADNASQLLNNMVPEIQKTATLVQEISAASIEQNAGAGQVNESIQQLNTITQQNAQSAEELSLSSEELLNQSERLQNVISFFNTVTGRRATNPTRLRQNGINGNVKAMKEMKEEIV